MLPSRLTSKPQYVLHPTRALRRVRRLVSGPPIDTAPKLARLPWGLPLSVHEADAIGYSILVGRVFDPCVTEAIHRLIEPGDAVVDVGANVGYLTSLAAVRAGAAGRVVAAEPHPVVFELLQSNADHAGRGKIVAGPLFNHNMGLASLAGEEVPATPGQQVHEVELRRLDELTGQTPIGVLKIDVEGHEAEVLNGATALLERRLIRDLVFEDHDPYPSAATSILEAAGYHLVSLSNDLGGLLLGNPAERGEVPAWPGPSYLATREPSRSFPLLAARGWRVGGIGLRYRRTKDDQ